MQDRVGESVFRGEEGQGQGTGSVLADPLGFGTYLQVIVGTRRAWVQPPSLRLWLSLAALFQPSLSVLKLCRLAEIVALVLPFNKQEKNINIYCALNMGCVHFE